MATPAKKTFKWDAEEDRDLFGACLVIVGEPKGATLGKAVALLHEMKGVTYSVKAATHRIQHLQKLKRKEGAAAEGTASAAATTSAATTPVKGPVKTAVKGPVKTAVKGNTKKRAKAAAVDDDEEDAGKTKKRRATGKKKEALSTPVVDDDEEEEDKKPLKTVKQELAEQSEDGI